MLLHALANSCFWPMLPLPCPCLYSSPWMLHRLQGASVASQVSWSPRRASSTPPTSAAIPLLVSDVSPSCLTPSCLALAVALDASACRFTTYQYRPAPCQRRHLQVRGPVSLGFWQQSMEAPTRRPHTPQALGCLHSRAHANIGLRLATFSCCAWLLPDTLLGLTWAGQATSWMFPPKTSSPSTCSQRAFPARSLQHLHEP